MVFVTMPYEHSQQAMHRTAAFLDLALLLIANLVMKTRLPSRRERPNAKPIDIKSILTDRGYWLCTIGYVYDLH